jgi:hypothetical protein
MIRRPFLLVVAAVLLLASAGLFVERALFALRAQKTAGNVIAVDAANDRCGSRRRSRHPCTKFTATVQFSTTKGEVRTHAVSAGSRRGYDQPPSSATLHEGDPVRVLYDPRSPSRAYRDSTGELWGAPLACGAGAALSAVSSFFTPRRRRWW